MSDGIQVCLNDFHTNMRVGTCAFLRFSLLHDKPPQTMGLTTAIISLTPVLGLTELSWAVLTGDPPPGCSQLVSGARIISETRSTHTSRACTGSPTRAGSSGWKTGSLLSISGPIGLLHVVVLDGGFSVAGLQHRSPALQGFLAAQTLKHLSATQETWL